jgi:hypothetical protein
MRSTLRFRKPNLKIGIFHRKPPSCRWSLKPTSKNAVHVISSSSLIQGRQWNRRLHMLCYSTKCAMQQLGQSSMLSDYFCNWVLIPVTQHSHVRQCMQFLHFWVESIQGVWMNWLWGDNNKIVLGMQMQVLQYLRRSRACLSVLGCCFPLQPAGTGSCKCWYSTCATSPGIESEKGIPASCWALASRARSLQLSSCCALRQASMSTPTPHVSMSASTFTCPMPLFTQLPFAE